MIRDILAKARIYSLFAQITGAKRGRQIYVQNYIRPKAGDRILDIGCGPADILEALPEVEYHGFDLSSNYIESARKRFGNRGSFHVEAVNRELIAKYAGFDLVLANGVLHHLNDAEATDLFQIAKTALKPGGALVTLDGCFVEGQSRAAEYLLRRDRGQFVRKQPDYLRLASQTFSKIESHLTHNLLRIPYTHLIMRCSRETEDHSARGAS
jgi:SAM-dependent methyltransferase